MDCVLRAWKNHYSNRGSNRSGNVGSVVAVTGFDNIPESAFTVPALTTINVHKQLIGELTVERVVKRIENEDDIALVIQTPTSLVVRQSCGSK